MREFTENTPTKAAGRPREFDEAVTIGKIMTLFWDQGYEGTSLSDIIKTTGLQKGSLYAAFGSKADMYAKALGHYEDKAVDEGCRSLRGAGTAKARLTNFMSAPLSEPKSPALPRGCFLCNASADHAVECEDTQRTVTRGFAKLSAALTDATREARPDWAETRQHNFAALCLTTYAGLRVISRSGGVSDVMRGAVDQVLATLDA